MNHKIFAIIKISGLLFLNIVFLGLINSNVFAASLDMYGNLYFEVADRNKNQSFKTTNPMLDSDLWAYTTGDIFLRGNVEDSLLQFLVDYKFEGYLNSDDSPEGYFNQYYIIAPLADNKFLYCGQKYKKVGVAKFFNISNRYERAGYPIKLIEYDILKSDNFNYGFITNFKGASQWDQIQYSGFVDLNLKNFNMQGYYFHEGTRGYSVVTNLTYQAGIYQIYGESLFMSQSDQVVVKLNSEDPSGGYLDYRDQNSATKMVVGMMMNQKNYSIVLEYMKNNKAYSPEERDDFIDYLARNPGRRKYYTDYFSYNWAQNNVGLSLYLPKLFGNDDCSLINSIIASLPDEKNSSEYTSYQFYSNVSYNIFQNLTVNFNITYHSGGSKGEYLNLYEDKTSYLLSMLYSF